ncbi:MAG: NAD(P)H-quinone oxidoreductase subunit F [Spirulinaceae cyanobacterium]
MTDFLINNYWFLPLYGLIGAILSLPWSVGIIRTKGPRPAAYINLFMTLLALVHGSIVLALIWHQEPQQLVFSWLKVADLDLSLAIEISPISMGAMEVVTGISFLVQIYALGYLEKDWSLARFYGLMGFFEAALSGIAISDSLFLTYGLLEMLTLSSYLLVGFWYAQPLVVTAARDAFLTKRVGDIILFMGVVALSAYGEGLNFSELGEWVQTSPVSPLTANLLGLALIAGPTGKCAQFPLNLWLDEAMEGPNPAGIMRNSVVVSAGAFVLIKLQPVFTLSPIASNALILIGMVTAIGASLIAIAQIDFKRALSHSTSAYLGLVFITVGIGQPINVALLLLFTHALAKSLLFMSAGSVILATSGQNVTEMGGLGSKMPATTIAFVVGLAGLVALLPMGMFWAMQQWIAGFFAVPWWLLAMLLLINCLSAINLTRVFRLVFLGQPQIKTRRALEAPWPMALAMVSLTVVTLLIPVIFQQRQLLSNSRELISQNGLIFSQFAVPLLVFSGAIGCLIGAFIELRRAWARPNQFYLRFIQDLLAYDFYIEKLYDLTVVFAVSSLSKITTWFDRYVVDGVVNLVGLFTVFSGNALKYSISGQSQFYLLTILIGVGLLLSWSMSDGQWSVLVEQWSFLIDR